MRALLAFAAVGIAAPAIAGIDPFLVAQYSWDGLAYEFIADEPEQEQPRGLVGGGTLRAGTAVNPNQGSVSTDDITNGMDIFQQPNLMGFTVELEMDIDAPMAFDTGGPAGPDLFRAAAEGTMTFIDSGGDKIIIEFAGNWTGTGEGAPDSPFSFAASEANIDFSVMGMGDDVLAGLNVFNIFNVTDFTSELVDSSVAFGDFNFFQRSFGGVFANVEATIEVIPTPAAAGMGLAGLSLLGARRRRNA